MKRVQEEFGEQGLRIIWIGFQDRIERLVTYANKMGISPVGYDAKDYVGTSFGITFGAGIVFIDSEGMVRKRIAKGLDEKRLRENTLIILAPSVANGPSP